MLPQGMLIDKKKYPRYTGRNSLSARLNSEHSDRLSFPRNFDNPIERNDNKTGIKNNEISNIQLGKLKMLKSSFIKYKIIIHEVAFIVNKNLNNKFILQSPSVLLFGIALKSETWLILCIRDFRWDISLYGKTRMLS